MSLARFFKNTKGRLNYGTMAPSSNQYMGGGAGDNVTIVDNNYRQDPMPPRDYRIPTRQPQGIEPLINTYIPPTNLQRQSQQQQQRNMQVNNAAQNLANQQANAFAALLGTGGGSTGGGSTGGGDTGGGDTGGGNTGGGNTGGGNTGGGGTGGGDTGGGGTGGGNVKDIQDYDEMFPPYDFPPIFPPYDLPPNIPPITPPNIPPNIPPIDGPNIPPNMPPIDGPNIVPLTPPRFIQDLNEREFRDTIGVPRNQPMFLDAPKFGIDTLDPFRRR